MRSVEGHRNEESGPTEHWLAPLLAPRRVALVGASPRADSVGHAMVSVLEGGGFDGEIWPVNPRYESIGERDCCPDLAGLPSRPDLAVLSVASSRMEQALKDAIAAGARSAVIFDPCMIEGEVEPRLLDRLKAIAREAGLPVCGGNGMGYYNYDTRTFVSFWPPLDPTPGTIALFCHSGSVFVLLANSDRRYRFNLVTSQGQEINGSVADYMDYALEQPSTRVLALFIEAVRDPDRFVAVLEKARQLGVPVVIAKVGRSEASARLARSHSGAIAGSDAAFGAVCDRFGAVRVADIDELLATAQLLAAAPSLGPGGLSCVLDSGGLRENLMDLAAEMEVPLTPLAPPTVERLKTFLPSILEPVNPLDAAGLLNDGFGDVIRNGIDTLADDPGTAALFVELQADDRYTFMPALLDHVKTVPARTGLPVAFVSSFSNVANARVAKEFAEAEVPVINGARLALVAARGVFAFRDGRDQPDEPLPKAEPELVEHWRTRLRNGVAPGETEALGLAAAFGMDVAASRVATSAAAAVEAAGAVGYPVALKTAMPGRDHKSDIGGVRLGLSDEAAVRDGWTELADALGPCVTVAAMAPAGVELAFGMVRDAQFGPVVMVGAGGLLVELLEDRVFALPPFGPATARRLIGRLRIARLLAGVRGRPASDMDAAALALSRFSMMAATLGRDAIAEIDLNPVICGPDRAIAVDALVVPG